MRFAFRQAWIELRSSRGRFLFVVLAIAAGVAALTGVRGFSESVRFTLLKEARALMGADLMVRTNAAPLDQDLQAVNALVPSGGALTIVTETVSMTAPAGATPVLASVKAADLRQYPFYGFIEFEPPAVPMMTDSTAVASDDLLLRLNVRVGDTIRVGNADFRIIAIARKEPDRMTTGFTLGPRVLISREGFQRAGLNVWGSRATHRILIRIPQGMDPGQIRTGLEGVFGRRGRVIDYTEANPTLSRNMERASAFLSMISLIALIVGGVGVATSIESHIQQRMDHIAIMKCIGGTSRTLMAVYAVQALILGSIGSLVGVAAGFAAQAAFPRFLSGYFDVQIDIIFSAAPVIQGVLIGLLTTLLFTLPPLLSISGIRPALIFRRDMAEGQRRARDPRAVTVFLAIALGMWGIAVWMSGSLRIGSYFLAGLIVSLLVLGAIARGTLRTLRFAVERYGRRMNPLARQAMANLYRPGTHVTAILVSLGVGVMFTVTVQLLQTSLLDQLRVSAPPDSPNVFLINVTNREKDALWTLVRSQEGVLDAPEPFPAVAAQLARINGTPVEEMSFPDAEQRYLRTQFALTWSDDLPKATTILDGRWWTRQEGEPLVSIEDSVADRLQLKVGDQLEWSAQGRVIRARVSSVRRTDAMRLGANNQFVLTRAALDGQPVIYYGALRMRPDAVGRLQRDVFARFPTVTVVNAADVIEVVQSVMDRMSLTVRFLSGFAIFGGVIILAAGVAGTRFRRMREVAVLKTVGATRSRIAAMFSVEFAVIGLIAGAIGGLLAALFSVIVVERLLDTLLPVALSPVLVAVVATVVVCVAAGWVASFRILGQKPLEVLRQAQD